MTKRIQINLLMADESFVMGISHLLNRLSKYVNLHLSICYFLVNNMGSLFLDVLLESFVSFTQRDPFVVVLSEILV